MSVGTFAGGHLAAIKSRLGHLRLEALGLRFGLGGRREALTIRPPFGQGRAEASACMPLHAIPYQEGFTLPFSFPDWPRASRRGLLESQTKSIGKTTKMHA